MSKLKHKGTKEVALQETYYKTEVLIYTSGR